MRIGLIADLHNHAEALERALALFERLGVDQVVCAGDVVEATDKKPFAASAVRTISILRQRNIACVQGNHDVRMIEHQRRLRTALMLTPAMREQWLDDDPLNYLTGLPHSLTFLWAGKRIYMTHATPWSKDEHISGKHPEQYQRMAAEAKADIVIVGHTHIAQHVQVGVAQSAVHILNPGAVWSEFLDNYRTCAVLTLPNFTFQVYDLSKNYIITTTTVIP